MFISAYSFIIVSIIISILLVLVITSLISIIPMMMVTSIVMIIILSSLLHYIVDQEQCIAFCPRFQQRI